MDKDCFTFHYHIINGEKVLYYKYINIFPYILAQCTTFIISQSYIQMNVIDDEAKMAMLPKV